ncbi:MAG: hypothetical protein RBS14_00105 [Atribacterota bacterium]|jgi:hypothetical protein|nr:hypothetical protein [Atribacterota bacterium]
MAKYRVKIKYGNPGEHKLSSQSVTVEAGSESTAMQLAISKFKNSNAAYRNKEVEVDKIEEI